MEVRRMSVGSVGRAAAVALLLATAGCGTTVRGANSAAGSSDALGASGSAGSGARVAAGSTGTGPGTANGLGATAPATSPGGGGSTIAVSQSGGRETGPTAGVAGNGPGVTKTSISIGVAYFQNANQANAAIGGKGIDVGDPTQQARIIVADLNRHGGIAGRKVVPLFFGVDPQSADTYAAEAQAECVYFTEDHKVFAVIDGTQAVGTMARPCLEQHGVAFLTDNSVVVSDVTAHEYDPDSVVWSRLFGAMVPSLSRQAWFTPWNRATGTGGATTPARIGIVTADRPALNRAVDGVLLPLLRAAGHPVDKSDVYRISPPGGFSDDGSTVAAIQSAVLRFNADGVDHVILTDSNGSISLLFNNYAYSQHYFPRYGGSTGNFWQTLLAAGDIQPATLAGSVAIGFMPMLDLPYTAGDGPRSNASRHRCLALMRAEGAGATSATVAASQLVECDAFWLLHDALRSQVAATVSSRTLLDRIDGLGKAFTPGLAIGDHFAAARHDGVAAGYDMSFDSGCGCYSYHGPLRTLGSG
jgi:hypothetical protein